MRIERQGSIRKSGWTTIVPANTSLKLHSEKKSKSVVLRVKHIRDYSGSFYDWDVSLDAGDIQRIIENAGRSGN
jgi:hypothetical protein